MLQGTVLVQANTLTPKAGQPAKADKNGLQSIILTAIAGAIPSNRTISGTIAESLGIVDGGVYLVDYTEREPANINGKTVRNFGWMKLNDEPIKLMEVVALKKEFGAPRTIAVGDAAAPVDPQTGGSTPPPAGTPDANAPQP